MSKQLQIRNSTAEFLIFQAEDKAQGVQVFYKDETIRATQFRQWCTAVLRQFAIRGYVIDKKRVENVNVYFENAGAEPNISDKDKQAVDELCAIMQEDKNLKVIIIGHTDNTGNPEQNLKVYGVKRAEVLKAYMVGMGVPADQISCESRGDKEPVAPNDIRANRALNRRANIRFL